MGILRLILRKLWTLILGSLPVAIFYILINLFDINVKLRDAFNVIIPLVAAIIAGILAQGIPIIYRAIKDTVNMHRREVLMLINQIIKLAKSCEKELEIVSVKEVEALYVHSKLCYAVNEIIKLFKELWQDLSNHYPDIKEKMENLCKDVRRHNSEVKQLGENIKNEITIKTRELIEGEKLVPIPLTRIRHESIPKEQVERVLSELMKELITSYEEWRDLDTKKLKEYIKSTLDKLFTRRVLEFSEYKWLNKCQLSEVISRKRESDLIDENREEIAEAAKDIIIKYFNSIKELHENKGKILRHEEEMLTILEVIKQSRILPKPLCEYALRKYP